MQKKSIIQEALNLGAVVNIAVGQVDGEGSDDAGAIILDTCLATITFADAHIQTDVDGFGDNPHDAVRDLEENFRGEAFKTHLAHLQYGC